MQPIPPNPFQMIYSILNAHGMQIRQLEAQVANLQRELQTLRQQRAIHVDRIEYKFDQLKVERLDGTLTIGLSPSDVKGIEDLTVDGKEVDTEGPPTPNIITTPPVSGPFLQAKEEIERFLREECPSHIQRLEAEHGIVLGPEYRTLIIEDIRKQIDKRIEHYVQASRHDGGEQAAPSVTERVLSDIRAALARHFENHLKGKGPS